MEKAFKFGTMAVNIKVNSKMTWKMAMVSTDFLMDLNFTVILFKTNLKVKELLNGSVVKNIQGNFKITWCMAMENLYGLMVKNT